MNGNDLNDQLVKLNRLTTRRDILKSAAYIGGIAALGSLIFASSASACPGCSDCSGDCADTCKGNCSSSSACKGGCGVERC